MSDLLMRPTNRADWSGSIYIREQETGDTIDCSSMTDLLIELEDPDTRRAVLTASLGNGVTAVDASTGEYSFTFTAAQMSGIRHKTYLFAGIIKDATQTLQLFKTHVTLEDGVVG